MTEQEHLTNLINQGDKLLHICLFEQTKLTAAETANFVSKVLEVLAYCKDKE